MLSGLVRMVGEAAPFQTWQHESPRNPHIMGVGIAHEGAIAPFGVSRAASRAMRRAKSTRSIGNAPVQLGAFPRCFTFLTSHQPVRTRHTLSSTQAPSETAGVPTEARLPISPSFSSAVFITNTPG
jgi:hypothetical protein